MQICHLRFLFRLKTLARQCRRRLYCTGHIHIDTLLNVRLQMPLKVGQLCESLLAIVTLIRLSVQMAQLVLLKVDQLREVSSTALAAVRLLAGVCHFVALHVALLRKGFVAEVALIWTLAAVYGIVSLQIYGLSKGLGAQITDKWPHIVMYLHVAVQVAAIAETLGAQLALIGSFVVIVHLLTVQRLVTFALKRLQIKRNLY